MIEIQEANEKKTNPNIQIRNLVTDLNEEQTWRLGVTLTIRLNTQTNLDN